MINNHVPTVFGVLVILAALAAPANAAEAIPSSGHASRIRRQIAGLQHMPWRERHKKNATIPVLWGQQENYLVKQLHDFESGARNVEVMSWMATTLSPEELGSAAAYFAKMSWPARPAAAAATTPPAIVAVCEVCHQQNLAGGLPAPRLAGQSYEYLVEAMRRFADGERTNNADMTKIMAAISPADRQAMARYISGL